MAYKIVPIGSTIRPGTYRFTFVPRLGLDIIGDVQTPKSFTALGYTLSLAKWEKDYIANRVYATIVVVNTGSSTMGIVPSPPSPEFEPITAITLAILGVVALSFVYLTFDKAEEIVEDSLPVIGSGINFLLIAFAIGAIVFAWKQLRKG